MLGNQNKPRVEEEDFFRQVGGLLGGAVEGVSDIAQGIGEFTQENPELVGLIGGGLLGGGRGAAGGLISGAGQRSRRNAAVKSQLLKQILPLQEKGATIATKDDLSLLPKDAFFTIGLGDQSIRLKKPPVKLSGEAAARIGVLQEAKASAIEVVDALDSGKLTREQLNKAALPIVKRSDEPTRQLAARLDLVSEGLGRALSGATIKESEIKNFRAIFTVQPFDSVETARFKINRAIRIIENVEKNAGIFLAGQGDDRNNKKNLTEYLMKELSSAKKDMPKDNPEPTSGGSTYEGFDLPN